MIKAILFDLDDTLIDNPPARFVKQYLARLTSFLRMHYPHLEEMKVLKALRNGVEATIQEHHPLHFNVDVFYADFTRTTGLPEAKLRILMREFYREQYPTLREFIKPRPEAIELVQYLLDQSYAIAVATSPLYENDPIQQRIRWGNLPPDGQEFWFVSTLETVHFAKPHPHYYEEILTRLGHEPDEALMVGDDWNRDIVPAAQAGLNTFWITDGTTTPGTDNPGSEDDIQPNAQGTLAEFLALVRQEDWFKSLQPRPLSPEQIIPRLLANVAALHGIVSEIPDHFWHQRPDPNEWSPMEVVVHLREREAAVQRKRLEHILREENPFLSGPELPPAPGVLDLTAEDGRAVVEEFAVEREQTIAFLKKLAPGDWARPARHSVFGTTSLLEMAAFLARHDRLHINQLCQTVGKCE
jgi:HAD superfamily hydrolase (TIGR01549 family)